MDAQGRSAAPDCSFRKSYHREARGGELCLYSITDTGTGREGRGCECWTTQGSPQDTGMESELALTEAWTGLENGTEERFPRPPELLPVH